MPKVAINGLGRIGRATFKILLKEPDLELVAVNDLIGTEELAYLLCYDSVYGRCEPRIHADGDYLRTERRRCRVFAEKNPEQLPWADLGIDLVFECTGIFTERDGMEKHLKAGAGRVILSAPSKSEDIPTVVHGVNEAPADAKLISCASCTTNCVTPVVEVMDRRVGVCKAVMCTTHAYTATQMLLDGASKKVRRGRAGAINLIPTSTGAAAAATRVLTHLDGKFDGSAIRAPVPVGSITVVSLCTKRSTIVEEINGIFREEAASDRYRGILGVADDHLVSSDIIRDPRASVVDTEMTQVVDGDLVQVMSWYDNEWGYSNQMVREARRILG